MNFISKIVRTIYLLKQYYRRRLALRNIRLDIDFMKAVRGLSEVENLIRDKRDALRSEQAKREKANSEVIQKLSFEIAEMEADRKQFNEHLAAEQTTIEYIAFLKKTMDDLWIKE